MQERGALLAIRKQSIRYARKAWGGRSGCARSADVGATRSAGTTRAETKIDGIGTTQVSAAPGLQGVQLMQLAPWALCVPPCCTLMDDAVPCDAPCDVLSDTAGNMSWDVRCNAPDDAAEDDMP